MERKNSSRDMAWSVAAAAGDGDFPSPQLHNQLHFDRKRSLFKTSAKGLPVPSGPRADISVSALQESTTAFAPIPGYESVLTPHLLYCIVYCQLQSFIFTTVLTITDFKGAYPVPAADLSGVQPKLQLQAAVQPKESADKTLETSP